MTYKVSNSDIKSLQKCEFNWFYNRYLNLTPHELPEVMEVGTFGHKLMERAFEVIMAGGTEQEAAAYAGELLVTVMQSPLKMKVYKNVLAFVTWFNQQGMKPLALEHTSFAPVAGDTPHEFAFTPDLIAEHTTGIAKGRISCLDYKFTGQYWSDREINAFSQVPKYVAYYRKVHGVNVTHGAVVMLNTRAMPTDSGSKLFLVKWLPINKARLQNLERENEIMTNRVLKLVQYGRDHGADALKETLVHTNDEKQCKFCFFADDLCPMDQQGKDTTRTQKYNYKTNTEYGYNDGDNT